MSQIDLPDLSVRKRNHAKLGYASLRLLTWSLFTCRFTDDPDAKVWLRIITPFYVVAVHLSFTEDTDNKDLATRRSPTAAHRSPITNTATVAASGEHGRAYRLSSLVNHSALAC